jgi:hypothetical protein
VCPPVRIAEAMFAYSDNGCSSSSGRTACTARRGPARVNSVAAVTLKPNSPIHITMLRQVYESCWRPADRRSAGRQLR